MGLILMKVKVMFTTGLLALCLTPNDIFVVVAAYS